MSEETTYLVTAGDRECYIYFDTEFTGLKRDTTLISIGLVNCDGKSFYAEFTDYNKEDVNEWIEENVIKNLTHPDNVLLGDHWTMQGTTTEISEALWKWLLSVRKDKLIQFVGDVSHYDFVLLIDLLLNDKSLVALELPQFISPCCVDINQDIATSIRRTKPDDITEEEFNDNFVPAYAAFNFNRNELASSIPAFKYNGFKHNSLYDANVVRAIHQNLYDIEK